MLTYGGTPLPWVKPGWLQFPGLHSGGTRIRELLQQAPPEAQEGLDQALESVLGEMTPQIDLLKSQMTRKVMDALEIQLQAGTG